MCLSKNGFDEAVRAQKKQCQGGKKQSKQSAARAKRPAEGDDKDDDDDEEEEDEEEEDDEEDDDFWAGPACTLHNSTDRVTCGACHKRRLVAPACAASATGAHRKHLRFEFGEEQEQLQRCDYFSAEKEAGVGGEPRREQELQWGGEQNLLLLGW